MGLAGLQCKIAMHDFRNKYVIRIIFLASWFAVLPSDVKSVT